MERVAGNKPQNVTLPPGQSNSESQIQDDIQRQRISEAPLVYIVSDVTGEFRFHLGINYFQA